MGWIYGPIFTMEPSIVLNALDGKVHGNTVGFGLWIPEDDLYKMGLSKQIIEYYKAHNSLGDIPNIEMWSAYRQSNRNI